MKVKEIVLMGLLSVILAFVFSLIIVVGIDTMHGDTFPGSGINWVYRHVWGDQSDNSICDKLPNCGKNIGWIVNAYKQGKYWVAWDANRQKYFSEDGGRSWALVIGE